MSGSNGKGKSRKSFLRLKKGMGGLARTIANKTGFYRNQHTALQETGGRLKASGKGHNKEVVEFDCVPPAIARSIVENISAEYGSDVIEEVYIAEGTDPKYVKAREQKLESVIELLEQELETLKGKNDTLQSQNEELTASYIEADDLYQKEQRKVAGLVKHVEEQKAKLATARKTESELISQKLKLTRQNEKLEDRVEQLELTAEPAENFYRLHLAHLASFATRLTELEAELGDAIYAAPRDEDALVCEGNELFGTSYESIEEVEAHIEETHYADFIMQAEELYKSEHAAEAQLAQEAAQKRATVEEAKAKIEGLAGMEEIIAQMQTQIEEATAKIQDFVPEMEAFKQEQGERYKQFIAKLTDEPTAVRAKNVTNEEFPMVVYYGDEEDAHRIMLYVPARDAKLTGLLLSEILLSDKFRELVDQKEFEEMQWRNDNPAKLQYLNIALPKDTYSLDDVVHIDNTLRQVVREAYNNTALPSLGLRIAIPVIPVVMPGVVSVAGEDVEQRREIIAHYIQRAGDKVTRSDIKEHLESQGYAWGEGKSKIDLRVLAEEERIERHGRRGGSYYTAPGGDDESS